MSEKILSFRESVRTRPGMYIGSTDQRGLYYLITGAIGASVDEAVAGRCNSIETTLNPDGSFLVRNNSPAVPLVHEPTYNIPFLELLMTYSPYEIKNLYREITGRNIIISPIYGLDFAVYNCLSEWCWVEVNNEGRVYRQDYVRGVPQGPIREIDPATSNLSEGWNNAFCFKPDLEIFERVTFDFDKIANFMQETAYLTSGLRLTLIDRRSEPPKEISFQYENGLVAYLTELNREQAVLHQPVYARGKLYGVQTEVAMQYTASSVHITEAFVNHNAMESGGTPVTGFRDALTRTINLYARKKGLLQPDEPNISGDSLRSGLTVVISVKLEKPSYSGPTKNGRIHDAEARMAVREIFARVLAGWLEEHPAEAKVIIEKARKARAGS